MSFKIEQFQQAAQINPKGELQVGDHGVENRGTLGNMALRFFQSIGAFLGLCQKPPAQQERQQAVMGSFTESLKARYGQEIARDALGQLTGPLTGAKVNKALTNAMKLEQENRLNNAKTAAKMLPGEYVEIPNAKMLALRTDYHTQRMIDSGATPLVQDRQTALEKFDSLVEKAGIEGADKTKFVALFDANNANEDNAHTLYKNILDGMVTTSSHTSGSVLTEQNVEDTAVLALKVTSRLKSKEDVRNAHQAIANCGDNFKTFLRDFAAGRDEKIWSGGAMGKSVTKVLDGYKEAAQALKAEKADGGPMSDSGIALFDAALGVGLSKLSRSERSSLSERLADKNNPLEVHCEREPRLLSLLGFLLNAVPQTEQS